MTSAPSLEKKRRGRLVRSDRLPSRLRLPDPQIPLDFPRDVHRAEFRPAHRAELGALEILGRQGLVVQLLRALRVEGKPELFLPVERVPGPRKGVVPVPGALPPPGDVRRMRGDLVRDHALPYLFG